MEKPTDMNKIASEMNRFSTLLKEAEKSEATLSGRLQESLKRLKEENGVASIEEAQETIKTLESEAQDLKAQIAQKFQALQTAYEW
jgi:gas vesicle protein